MPKYCYYSVIDHCEESKYRLDLHEEFHDVKDLAQMHEVLQEELLTDCGEHYQKREYEARWPMTVAVYRDESDTKPIFSGLVNAEMTLRFSAKLV